MGRVCDRGGVDAQHAHREQGLDRTAAAAGELDTTVSAVLDAAGVDDAAGEGDARDAGDGLGGDLDDELDPELRADLAKVRSLVAECDAAPVVSAAKLKGLSRVVESLRRDAFDHPEHGARIVAAADLLAASVASARKRVPPPAVSSKQSRNAPCVCGSGRKAKACCS